MASMASTSRVDADAPEPRMPPASISIDAAHEDAPPRLFIVCGRDRKAEDLREMFGACGAIRHFHLATDRSNKSRGFAFLQYEDAASADEAIKKFDQMTLSDGHILKVTIAREKTASDSLSSHKPPGKLKRNQHHEEENENEGAIDDADAYHHPPQYFPHFQPSTVSPPIVQSAQPQLRSRLFFIATFKFTLQELRAMFSVYGDIETVQIVPSFGKIKTMAYIKYASPSTAHNVLSSFMEEQDEASAETMKLTYADDDEVSTPAFPQRCATPPAPAAVESTSSEDISGYYSEPLTSDERCWVLILYHSDLTNEEISSCVDDSDGFQFLDIKMFRSTGRPQGVAFARFDTEETAQAASLNLHNLEFPTESQRYLQAMVISDPSLFSTPHTVSVDNGPNSRRPHSGEDGDLGAVEARFAHLMSSGEQSQRTTSVAAVAVPTDEDVHYTVPAHPSVPMGPPPAQPPYMVNHGSSHYEFSPFAYQYPPASSHPFSYPPQVWSYDAPPVHPPWMAHSPGPMQPQFGSFAWGPPSNGYFEFGQTETSATEEASSVFISSSRPVDLSALMAVLKDCPGVVGFAKEERAFVVDFSEPRLAVETARKLDGTMCNGQKLRVTIAGSHRPPPSRRKRQRLDGRARK
ncbi:hypothetical protein Poli38472_010094 [Pythium oligandrum]|uniref:RRM domain-containing protein n=1 Tax=Pythium oligandrum TaxID=41045 RepID=A0A8K1C927_PYTOL|nr:hypothetical protein Poli38472_010094 [Pythium oligandrum]|eukprot:TMW58535.1 hypothetical protein Poli38472_010094 [Pythium oligandrum]